MAAYKKWGVKLAIDLEHHQLLDGASTDPTGARRAGLVQTRAPSGWLALGNRGEVDPRRREETDGENSALHLAGLRDRSEDETRFEDAQHRAGRDAGNTQDPGAGSGRVRCARSSIAKSSLTQSELSAIKAQHCSVADFLDAKRAMTMTTCKMSAAFRRG